MPSALSFTRFLDGAGGASFGSCGGIGRHDGLKIRWRNPCGFESHHEYHAKEEITMKIEAKPYRKIEIQFDKNGVPFVISRNNANAFFFFMGPVTYTRGKPMEPVIVVPQGYDEPPDSEKEI
jgi:hypothetical protein